MGKQSKPEERSEDRFSLSTVADAEATVTRLQAQREQLLAERAKAEGETGRHAYAAHAQGDMKALEALDEIATSIARLDARIREVGFALAEANRVLLEARQAAATAADRAKAEEARKIAQRIAVRLGRVDEHFAHAFGELRGAIEALDELHAAGVTSPSDTQFRVHALLCLKTVIGLLPRTWRNDLTESIEIGPLQRTTFTDYWQKIQPTIDNQLRPRRGEAEQQKQKEPV
jgi:hypothetical protein